MSEKIADFSLKHQGNSYSRNAQGQLVSVTNWETEGDMDVYGTVWGSITFLQDIGDANADGGTCSWAGEGFLPDGSKVIGFQEGTWEKSGNHKWKLVMEGEDSSAGKVRTESEIELSTLIWEGTVYSRD